ncbi:mite allergen Lep d 7, partial [Trichonephila clavata]
MKLPITSIIPGSNANEYIDQILFNVQKYVKDHHLEPMQLPEFTSNFTKEVMYVKVSGEAKLYDGWLAGVSTIHRTDECELRTNKTTISVSAHLGLNNLKLAYK